MQFILDLVGAYFVVFLAWYAYTGYWRKLGEFLSARERNLLQQAERRARENKDHKI